MRFSARVFSSRRKLGRAAGVRHRLGLARRGALDRPRLDDPVAVDAQEPLGRGAQDGDLAEPEQGGERRGVARPQGQVGGHRVERARAAQLGRQADLVALALEDLAPARGDVLEVGVGRVVEREAQAAGRGGRGRQRRRLARERAQPLIGGREPGVGVVAAVGVGQRDQVDPALAMVEGDDPVAQQERGVGQRRGLRDAVAALGLELVAEVAREPADEVERQLGRVGAQAVRARGGSSRRRSRRARRGRSRARR